MPPVLGTRWESLMHRASKKAMGACFQSITCSNLLQCAATAQGGGGSGQVWAERRSAAGAPPRRALLCRMCCCAAQLDTRQRCLNEKGQPQ